MGVKPLTPAKLKKEHDSLPRNHLIANNFFLIRNIEQWGEGTNKIVKWSVNHGLKEPDFKEIGGGFMVVFYAPKDILALIPEKGKTDLKEMGLNERQIEGLRLMINRGEKLTIQEYAMKFDVSSKTAKRDIKELVETGYIKKVGVKKGAFFEACP
ncbi:MAG: ATP-binding protein [Candidatus Woesearchaeota archaeon]